MRMPFIAPFGVLVLALTACPGDDGMIAETTGEDSTSTSTTGSSISLTSVSASSGITTESTTNDTTTTSVDTGSTGGTDEGTDTGTDEGTDTGTDTGTDSSGGSTTTGVMCMAPEEDCDGMCIDVTMSDEHCGMCGRVCMMGDTCGMSLCNGSRELISNGDFAAGIADWTAQNNPDQVLTCDSIQDDENYVFTDGGGYVTNERNSNGPSSHAIFQDFMVPMGVTTATFSFDYAQNPGGMLDPANVQTIVKDCLDENMDGFEQNAFRIDLIDPAADVFVAPILFEVATPDIGAGDPIGGAMLVNLMNADPALLTFLQGQEGNMLRLRIAQVESTMPWNIAFDNVSIAVDVAY